MSNGAGARPREAETPPYYRAYIGLVPDGDVLVQLEQQGNEIVSLLRGLSDQEALYRYADGKWSVKQVVGHLADTERVFAYRALAFARGDATALPGFEQDDYVSAGHFDRRALSELLDDLHVVRAATLALFRSFGDQQWNSHGTANGVGFSVRAIAWIVAGHELHHRGILEERYGVGNIKSPISDIE